MAEVEYGDDKAVPSRPGWGDIRKFKGKEGKTERIFLIEEKAVAAWTHYFVKGYFRCLAKRTPSDNGMQVNKTTCPMCVRVAEHIKRDPKLWKGALDKLRIGTNVIYYSTDKSGEVIPPFSVETRIWIFDQQKFSRLGAIKKEWGPLQNYDIKVDTEDATFPEAVLDRR